MSRRFKDRREAGQVLGKELSVYANRADVLVLGLPRGGIPVAFEVAKALGTPLDVFVVRKLGVPDLPELAMGAIASGGIQVIHQPVVQAFKIPDTVINQVAASEQQELERREQLYRGNRPVPKFKDQIILLIDDGLATGATMRAAVMALRDRQPGRIVVAIPIAPPETCDELRSEVDEVICPITPERFSAVAKGYEDFSQTSDEEVQELLEKSANWQLITSY